MLQGKRTEHGKDWRDNKILRRKRNRETGHVERRNRTRARSGGGRIDFGSGTPKEKRI